MYLLLGTLFLFLGTTVIFSISYFQLQNISTSIPDNTDQKQMDFNKELKKRLDAETATMPAKLAKIDDKCLVVPIAQDISIGRVSWQQIRLLTEDKFNKGNDKFYDFIYEGNLKGFNEIKDKTCLYYQLDFSKDNSQFSLNIPKGINLSGQFAKLDPAFLQFHKNEDIKLKIQYFSINNQSFSPLKFIEWEIKELKIN